jgi:toxin ParE1/3/4
MKLEYSDLAEEHLASIAEYTREHWGNHQATIYLAQIENRILGLLKIPYLGTPRPDISDGYRYLPEGKHLIFYRVDGDVVNILGIPHASMDLGPHLE